ncbi:MAG: prolyl oligopeptidase family serine peptidase [Alloacidobacterium sp.]|jgi:prolyl oligopeptidase
MIRHRWLILACLSISSLHSQTTTPPVAPVRVVTDEYFGQKIDDPYRYLEDQKNADVIAWMKAQADYTHAVLDSMPGRVQWVAEMKKYMNAADFTISDLQIGGDLLFYRKRKRGENQALLYVRPLAGGAERLLLDPDKFGTAEHHGTLDQYAPSWDGKYVSVGVSLGGSEDQTGYLIETATARLLPEKFERFEGGFFSPDNRTVYYMQLQKLAPGVPATDKYKKMREYAHTLGSDTANDTAIFGYGVSDDVKIPPEEAGFAVVTPVSSYAVGVVYAFVAPQREIYIAKADALEKKSGWKKIASYSDQVSDFAIKGNDVYLLTLKDAPNGKVLRLDAANPDLAKAEVVVPESKAVLTGGYVGQGALQTAADALYIQEAEGGIGKVFRLPYGPGAKAQEIPPPLDGSVDSVMTDAGQPGAILEMASWTRPSDYFRYDPATGKTYSAGLVPPNSIDPTEFVSEEQRVKAEDGTLVPLSIIYRKGMKLDGSNPTALIGYGSYGDVWKPGFSRRYSAWIERGGILAVAHVRGGGEYGETWHLAGQKLNKPNTWKDFIASAQSLIDNKYTSTPKLGIWSQSAGGILIGRSITERPDLFAAAVDGVPCSDMVRQETGPNGPPNIPEFGSVKTEDGFRGLYQMSAYYHVKDGTKYPAVLVTAGANDPRVDPWQGGKMAARLQAATSSGKPILLRVNYDAGHGITDTIDQ